jgi:hypothetical protein
MKQWKRPTLLLAAVLVAVGLFLAYRAVAKYRDLQETLSWMDQTYNPHEGGDNLGQGHGWEIHYLQKGNLSEEVTEEFNTTFKRDGGCKIIIRSETLPVGVWSDVPSVSTYTVSLCDIDPDTIKVMTYDLHKDVFSCSDPEQVQLYKLNCNDAEIVFLTRNGATVIDEELVQTFTKLEGKDHELSANSKKNKCWLAVDDAPYAQRLAKALRHAVELCGGKASRF